MGNDYIPRDKAARAAWLANFAAKLQANQAALNLKNEQVSAVTDKQTALTTAAQELADAQANLNAKQAAFNMADQEAVSAARAQARQLQANPAVTDAMRAEFGLPVRDTTPTAPAPLTSRPVVTIDFSQRGQHKLEYRDSETPNSRARPANATGCEIRRHVGTAPPDGTSAFEYLDTDQSSPYTVAYTDADAGKVASYILRWVHANGNRGPWSETVSATITA